MKMTVRPLFALLLCLAGTTAQAIVPVGPPPETLSPPRYIMESTGDESVRAAFVGETASWAAFVRDADGRWDVRVDALTGNPSLLWGSGTPWGTAGNAGVAASDMEQTARLFLKRYPDLFGVSPEALVLSRSRSGAYLDGQVAYVDFGYQVGGIPVEGARVFFRINHGRLIQAGSHLVPRGGFPSVEPRIGAEEALAAAASRLRTTPAGLKLVEDWRLLYDPEVRDGRLQARLVWEGVLARPGDWATWVARVDAATGELTRLWDRNRYACSPATLTQGRVDGGVPLVVLADPDAVRPMPYALVDAPGGPVTADFNGIFPYTSGAVSTGLNGRYVNVECSGCTSPPQVYAASSTSGDLHLGVGGSDTTGTATGNGISHRSERTAFYHVNLSRSLAAKWLPGLAWLDSTMPARVNLAATCNAFFDGMGINFFRAGGGCTNTGENPGVIQHEWGHAIDANTGYNDDGARGEGIGDIVDILIDHNPLVGPGFMTNGDPVRNLDENDPNNGVGGVLDTTTVTTECPADPNGGPLGYEVHCEGQIYAQAHYHLALALVAKTGSEFGGWSIAEKLFFASLPASDTYVPGQAGSSYDAYLAVDDDNGNLTDGTPNLEEIHAAFAHHGIAGTPPIDPPVNSSSCPAVTAPVLTLTARLDTTDGTAQVQVDWTAVAGATGYKVLRSPSDSTDAYQEIATVVPPAVTWLDRDVVNGGSYTYIVQAVQDLGGGLLCVSFDDNHADVTVSLAEVTLESFSFTDDVPGNSNGVWMPGEGVTVPIVVSNPGGAPALAVTAVLQARDPRITVVNGTSTFGDIAPGGTSGPPPDPFQVTTPADWALCGQALVFDVLFSADAGGGEAWCWSDAIELTVGAGLAVLTASGARADDFAAGNASGYLDPGETSGLLVTFQNAGTGPATGVTATLTSPDPLVAITTGSSGIPDVAAGGQAETAPGFNLTLDGAAVCGGTVSFDWIAVAAEGCWRGSFTVPIGGPESVVTILFDDFEQDTGWTSSKTDDDAGNPMVGQFERAAPEQTVLGGGFFGQPGSDHTPDPGALCWVTGPMAGAQGGAFDVDRGCTTVLSPAYDLSTSPEARVEYWRWYTITTSLDDEFVAEVSNDDGGSWSPLETLTNTAQPWALADFSIAAALGAAPSSQVRFRFTVCDHDQGSLVEALVDDFRLYGFSCDAPSPRPEVVPTAVAFDDMAPTADSNGNGFLDPGETVEVRVTARNVRNAGARLIAGTLSLVSAPAGTTLLQTAGAWPDLASLAEAPSDMPGFLLQVPANAPCGGPIVFRADLTYQDLTGNPYDSTAELTARIGRVTGSATQVLLFDDMEGPTEDPWVHGMLANQDDWQKGTPAGSTNACADQDPTSAHSGTQCWGNDLGGGNRDGCYRNNTSNYLETTLDTRGVTGLTLHYWRWLAVESHGYDQAEISVNGTVVWQNPSGDGNDVRDDLTGGWNEQTVSLSPAGDNQAAARIRFSLTSDAGLAFGGWNVDDVEVSGIAESYQCEPYGCAGPPSPVGDVLRVSLPGGQVQLDWSAYSGDAVAYNVYRDKDPGAVLSGSTTPPVYPQVVGKTQGDGDPRVPPALVFYMVRGTDNCGQEELP